MPHSLQEHIHPSGEGPRLRCFPLVWGERKQGLGTENAAVSQLNTEYYCKLAHACKEKAHGRFVLSTISRRSETERGEMLYVLIPKRLH